MAKAGRCSVCGAAVAADQLAGHMRAHHPKSCIDRGNTTGVPDNSTGGPTTEEKLAQVGRAMKRLVLVEVPFTTRPRAAAGYGMDLFWKGAGWFHVYRDGCKVGVTCDRQFWSRHEGKLAVFREKEAGET